MSNGTCKVSQLSTIRARQLSALHKCKKFRFRPVSYITSRDLVCTTADKKKTFFRFLLLPYVAIISEREHPLGFKRGAQTARVCHLCLTKQEKLSVEKLCSKKTLAES